MKYLPISGIFSPSLIQSSSPHFIRIPAFVSAQSTTVVGRAVYIPSIPSMQILPRTPSTCHMVENRRDTLILETRSTLNAAAESFRDRKVLVAEKFAPTTCKMSPISTSLPLLASA